MQLVVPCGCSFFVPCGFDELGILASFFQGFLFFILQHYICGAGCTLDMGAILAILASVFYVLAAISSCLVGTSAIEDDGGLDDMYNSFFSKLFQVDIHILNLNPL
mmetsp:Transcript_33792/g.50885  ORF Transcript_33792/g.50885 Transcript_33792/m.50885 type:complete len:106 (-) Transcript_33792:2460-2777(-)